MFRSLHVRDMIHDRTAFLQLLLSRLRWRFLGFAHILHFLEYLGGDGELDVPALRPFCLGVLRGPCNDGAVGWARAISGEVRKRVCFG